MKLTLTKDYFNKSNGFNLCVCKITRRGTTTKRIQNALTPTNQKVIYTAEQIKTILDCKDDVLQELDKQGKLTVNVDKNVLEILQGQKQPEDDKEKDFYNTFVQLKSVTLVVRKDYKEPSNPFNFSEEIRQKRLNSIQIL